MTFIARWLLVSLLAAPVVGAPANDAAVAAPLLWMRDRSLTASASALLTEMRDAEKYGLRSRDYGADTLAQRAASLAPNVGEDALVALDRDISNTVGRFVTQLHSGRISPRAVGHDLDVPHREPDSVVAVRALAQSHAPLEVLADYEPAFHHYDLLRAALSHYRALAAGPQPAPLPASGRPSVKPGESYAGMASLRARLVQLGDLEKSALTSNRETC